jgi:hypothetical protein
MLSELHKDVLLVFTLSFNYEYMRKYCDGEKETHEILRELGISGPLNIKSCFLECRLSVCIYVPIR